MLAETWCASSRAVPGRAGQVDLGMLYPGGLALLCCCQWRRGHCLWPVQPCAGKAGASRGAGDMVELELELVTCSGPLKTPGFSLPHTLQEEQEHSSGRHTGI